MERLTINPHTVARVGDVYVAAGDQGLQVNRSEGALQIEVDAPTTPGRHTISPVGVISASALGEQRN